MNLGIQHLFKSSNLYNACLAITGCFRRTARQKKVLWAWLTSVEKTFYNIINGHAPQYLSDHLPPQGQAQVNLRRSQFIFWRLVKRYRNSFFPYCISQWNSLDSRIRSLLSISSFKRPLLEFLRPKHSPTFRVVK